MNDETLFNGQPLETNHPDYVVHGDQAEVRFGGERLNGVREIVVSSAQHAKLADRSEDIVKLKEELRLKMAAKYGNRHDRRQAEAMGRKAATKARHLAWKKALQKGTPVAATPLPAGAHQPGILNSAQWAVRQLDRSNYWVDAGGSGTEVDS